MKTVEQLVADVLGIPEDEITDDLSYQSISAWDSLGHVALMLELEQQTGRAVDDDTMLALRSVLAIRGFTDGLLPVPAVVAPDTLRLARGLEGIHFDSSTITHIDGEAGVLEYRGYAIADLAHHAPYEDVAHLLIMGHLPDDAEASAFREVLREARQLPSEVLDLVRSLSHVHPAEAVRTCVSVLGAFTTTPHGGENESEDAARTNAVTLLGQVPMLVAAHHAFRSGRAPSIPTGDVSQAEAMLHVLLGQMPSSIAVRALNRILIVHADHGSNASAFSARVAIGCRATITAALTSAIAAFAGSLHGGAAERVVKLMDDVGTPERAREYVERMQSRGGRVMGFGHRVYRSRDPRVAPLRSMVVELSEHAGDETGLEVLDAVSEAMLPYARHGVVPNVDLYTGLAYRLLGLPDDLATPLFVAGRTAGWAAQCLEQQSNNVLIRPLLDYVGPHGLTYSRARATP